MSVLTSDQLKKIEENKRVALQKKQQALAYNPTGLHSNSIKNDASAWNLTTKTKPPWDKKKEISSSLRKECIVINFQLISGDRFVADMKYHSGAIEIMRKISGKAYDNETKRWTFPLSEHDSLVSALTVLKSEVDVKPLPRNVINIFKVPTPDLNVEIDNIDEVLLSSLLPFQTEGVRFGISRRGRCLIADDMGLGKTIQALGIAHYYREKWPLLIVCPSSMRFPWEEAIHRFLPSVNPFHVIVVTGADDCIHEANIVIISYDRLKTGLDQLKMKRFGVIIFDESHFLKTMKSGRTQAALQLAPRAQHVILLSGTPALSRPQELYPQICLINPTCFKTFHDFGVRYCNGNKTRFCWDYSGSSNSAELDILLKRNFMIRRLKPEVVAQLPSKIRKVVMLKPHLVKAISKQMDEFATQMQRKRGTDKRGTLLQYYYATGSAKLRAVQEYLEDKLEQSGKMLIFAHHAHVLDGLCDLLIKKHVDHIRIDGSTSAECRAQFCNTFQSDPETRVAVLSIKAANSGITLTAAQLVLFAELFWNPGELVQAEDRAHRLGQQDSVIVEYLIAKGTADDHLWNLVQSKLIVLNSVGLSKDSFKDVCNVNKSVQPTAYDMFQKIEVNQKSKNEESVELSESFEEACSNINFSQEDNFGEDDVFENFDLACIENEYASECKKPKLS